MYFFVQLHDQPNQLPDRDSEHAPFIDGLIARNAVLLGGQFLDPPQPGVRAAYVLRCDSLEEARVIAASDPAVRSQSAKATVSPWELVAVNTAAIETDLVVTPADIPDRERSGASDPSS